MRINTAPAITAVSQLLIQIQPLTQRQHQQGAGSQAIILSVHISADQLIVSVNVLNIDVIIRELQWPRRCWCW